MPTTITASNGNVYHLWQLTCQVKDYTEDVEYTTLDNELADGYWSQILYGSEVGVRTFNLTLPTVTDSTNDTVTGPYGETLTKRAYLRALHAYTVVEGKPFAVQSSENGQYYLVRFADRKLSLGRMMTKLYSTGLLLKQVRIDGVTIVDLNNIPGLTGHSVWWYNETGHGMNWDAVDKPTSGEYGVDLVKTGDVVFSGNPQNGLNTVRFNGTLTTGKLLSTEEVLWREIFIVMKIREATFGQTSVVLASDGVEDVLVGTNGTAKFAALPGGIGAYEYRLNGTLHESTDQQAPMNVFGIVHIQAAGGLVGSYPLFGQSQGGAGSQAEIDIAEIFATSGVITRDIQREITEHFLVKWGIGI